MDLSPEQNFAVSGDFESPLMVIAGAGSGKTRVLVGRVEKMLASGIIGNSVAIITFTKVFVDFGFTHIPESGR